MATTDAVSAVCNAIKHILDSSMASQGAQLGLATLNPRFEVYTSRDFGANGLNHVTSGATIFLYRALPNLAHRSPRGRVLSNGERQLNRLALDLHLIITIWGDSAETQNRLVGWVLRTLEDYPTIPAAVLNLKSTRPIFDPNETVELVLSEMDGDELLQLWDMLGDNDVEYHLSIPYTVRAVQIDSLRTMQEAEPVQVRTQDTRQYAGSQS